MGGEEYVIHFVFISEHIIAQTLTYLYSTWGSLSWLAPA